MPTWYALTVTDALGERRELVELLARADAEDARDEVLHEDPNLSKIVRVQAVEVADV